MYPSRHTRTLSPPLSTTSGLSQVTTTQQPRLNVVTRLAIQGKVKQGQDGASIKIYLKLSIPVDSVSPGSTIPLFPEENLKLLSAQVHPIDSNSVPYAFSGSTCPMLNNAARALNLPPRSSKSYLSLFGVQPAASLHSGRASSSSASAPNAPLDDRYTGHIIVSGYSIAYILPKDLPPRSVGDESALRVSTFSAAKMRRPSITERSNIHFMAVVDLFVPFASRPPRAPFLISIPIPRCLSNNLRLRIFPPTPTSTSASIASLSSAEEDPGAWELTSEPHVTRTTSRASRSGSYGNMADDESSDSSAYAEGSSGGIVIHGTFPSSDRLRVRWAQPTKTILGNGDSRRRVGVREVKGEMSTLISGKARHSSSGREGVLMKVEYKGTCKGVWFPGVATMLGMDVVLDTKSSDVYWAPGEEVQWSISGGAGYTGFDVGPSTPITRPPSLEFPSAVTSSGVLQAPPMTANSSTSSLLRAPLPADHLPDYSFEGSPTSLAPSGTLSSISSAPLTPGGRSRAPSDPSPYLPSVPLTIHINMNDIIPPANNVFTFTISGIILVIPKTRSGIMNGRTSHSNSSSEDESDPIPVVLPRFTVLAADSETISTTIRNETEGATVEVYNMSGDLRDAQTRRTVLQHNGTTRCGSDGGRIALRSISQLVVPRRNTRPQLALENRRLSPRPKTPTGHRESAIAPPSAVHTQGALTRRRRSGPLIIPSVDVLVTPLLLEGSKFPNAHAVRMHMHVPPDADSDWLEFGLARATDSTAPSGPSSSVDCEAQPHVDIDIINADVDGIPVRFENRMSGKQNQTGAIDLGPSFNEKSRNDWITWVKVQVGEQGGRLSVDYVVKQSDKAKPTTDAKGKSKAINKSHVDILIPTFALAVGMMDVTIDPASAVESVCTNLAHHQQTPHSYQMLHYSLEEFFCPKLTLHLRSDTPRAHMSYTPSSLLLLLGLLPIVFLLILLTNVGSEFRKMRHAFDLFVTRRSLDWEQFPTPVTETVFVTTTVFTPSSQSLNISPTSVPSTFVPLTTPIHSASWSSSAASSRPLEQTTPTKGAEPPQFTPQSSEDSLSPISTLAFEWFPSDLIPTAQRSWQELVKGLGVVWQVFRQVYHYPLDPP